MAISKDTKARQFAVKVRGPGREVPFTPGQQGGGGGGGGGGDPEQILRWSDTERTPTLTSLNGDGTVLTYVASLADPLGNNNEMVVLANGDFADLPDKFYFEIEYFDFEIDGVPETGGNWAFGMDDSGLYGALAPGGYSTENDTQSRDYKQIIDQLSTDESIYNLRETLVVTHQHTEASAGYRGSDFPHTQPSLVKGYAVDAPSGKVWNRYNNGPWLGGGDPALGTNPTFSPDGVSVDGNTYDADYLILNGSEFLPAPPGDPQAFTACAFFQFTTAVIFQQGGDPHGVKIAINGGARPLVHTPPAGYELT